MPLILPNEQTVLNAYAVLIGETPGNAALNEHLDYINANGTEAYTAALDSIFASTSTAQLASALLDNLSLSSVFTQEDAEAYLTANAGNRVGAMLDLASALYNYDGDDAGILAAQTAYTNSVSGSYNYSIDPANTAGQSLEDPAVSAGGQTFSLTVDQDTLTGTAGNDTFVAGAAQDGNGSLIDTLQSVDFIDGGDGSDTLKWTDSEGNTVTPEFANIEMVQARFTDGWGELNLSAATGVEQIIVSNSTDDGTFSEVGDVASFEFRNNAGADDITIEDGTATQLDVTISDLGSVDDGDTAFIDFDDNDATSLTVDITDSDVEIDVDGGSASVATLNVAATGENRIDASDGDLGDAVETLTVTGTGSVDFDGTWFDAASTVDASDNSGGVTGFTVDDPATDVTLGSGDDEIQYAAAVKATATVDLGDGDDTLNVGAVGITAGATVDAGDGQDTLESEHAQWALVEAFSAANRDKLTGFEALSISDVLADGDTVDMSTLDSLEAFQTAGVAAAGTATVSELDSGETVIVNGDLGTDTGTLAIDVADAADDDDAELNLNVEDNGDDGTAVTATVQADDVETVNVDVTGDDADTVTDVTLALTDDELVTLNLSGNDMATFVAAAGMSGLATIDASANEAGVDLDVSAVSNVTVTGTAEDDSFTLGDLSTVTGGDGDDAFVVSTPTNGNSYSTIADLEDGETITFTDVGDASGSDLSSMIELADTAAFNDYLEAATAGDGFTNGIVSWFQYDGNTYVVQDGSSETQFDAGTDEIVKLTGLVDLSDSTVSDASVLTYTVG